MWVNLFMLQNGAKMQPTRSTCFLIWDHSDHRRMDTSSYLSLAFLVGSAQIFIAGGGQGSMEQGCKRINGFWVQQRGRTVRFLSDVSLSKLVEDLSSRNQRRARQVA
ncbi:predicted protein [Coccidioides posadasii str. Silveira]|uniref:Predicted protein n=2 Tax=Coccidioides posadasii TaxID=199306 RepID=E9D3P5_COCPS|nr:predicted protein [Coccidioides posadasii str. Silveira]KMM65926.1 hypothetical protein CPAG_02267 [Coccidioides posadasii RMSCC 3488]